MVEADPQRLCKSSKGTILCLALDKNRRPRIERFLHLWEMHDEVLLDFPVKMKRGAAGGLHQLLLIPVEADDLPVIIHQRICRMRHDKELPRKPIDAQKCLHEL